jgi:hemoglobin
VIVEYIRYVMEPGRADAFRAAYARAADLLQADPRCLSYEIAQGIEEPTRFVVRIEWDSLEGHLDGFRRDPAFGAFFALVRPYVDAIEEMHHYQAHTTSPAVPEKGRPSLYDWAGGYEAISAFLNVFYDRVEDDELLRRFFPGGVTVDHRKHVTAWWSEVLGGPARYTPAGGYPRMVAHHLGLEITADQRRRFVTLLSVAADEAGLPDDPEFRAAIVGYAEWATRLAMHNSQVGADVVREAPLPRWGWGVAPPYLPEA